MGITSHDGEQPDVFSSKTPRARKEYRCQECTETIRVGDIYRRDFIADYNGAETHIICKNCDELIDQFFKVIPNEYRHELTFEYCGLHAAIIELRNEYGAAIEGFKYPPAEVYEFPKQQDK